MWPGIPDTYQKLPESDSGSFRYTRSRDYRTPTRHALLGSGRPPKTALYCPLNSIYKVSNESVNYEKVNNSNNTLNVLSYQQRWPDWCERRSHGRPWEISPDFDSATHDAGCVDWNISHHTDKWQDTPCRSPYVHHRQSSVPFLSHPRSEGCPPHGRTFSIYLCPLSFWLTLPQRVLQTK